MSTLPLTQPASNPMQAVSGLKTWAFVVSLLGTIVTCTGGWVAAQKAIERNSTKIEHQEKKIDKFDNKIDKYDEKFDIIIDKLNALDVKLERKQDRQK